MTVLTSTRCKIYIGPTAADTVDTSGEFAALSYTEISQVQNMGEFGDAFNDISVAHLNDGRQQHYKGIADAGVMNLVLSYDGTDAGQIALLAAAADTTSANYAFKVTFNNEGTGSPQNPETFYFRGTVGSQRRGGLTPDSVITLNADIRINSALVRVAAV
jgi:hypothetical protein